MIKIMLLIHLVGPIPVAAGFAVLTVGNIILKLWENRYRKSQKQYWRN